MSYRQLVNRSWTCQIRYMWISRMKGMKLRDLEIPAALASRQDVRKFFKFAEEVGYSVDGEDKAWNVEARSSGLDAKLCFFKASACTGESLWFGQVCGWSYVWPFASYFQNPHQIKQQGLGCCSKYKSLTTRHN